MTLATCAISYHHMACALQSSIHMSLMNTCLSLLPQLGFKSTFPQEEKTTTVPRVTKALEYTFHYTKLGVYHGCVVVVGFPLAVLWAIIAAGFSFLFTWFILPAMNLVSVASKMLLPLLRLPMQLFSEVFAPCIEVCVRSCVQVLVAHK